jgi:hypothetical protein
MKYFFLFFLILLPTVTALAITPTEIDFGELERGQTVTRELLIINTLDQKTTITINGIYKDSFVLKPNEKKLLQIPFTPIDKEDGIYKEDLIIQEDYGTNLVNAIRIPVHYKINGGKFSYEDLNLEGIKTDKRGIPLPFMIGAGSLLTIGTAGIIQKRKKNNNI